MKRALFALCASVPCFGCSSQHEANSGGTDPASSTTATTGADLSSTSSTTGAGGSPGTTSSTASTSGGDAMTTSGGASATSSDTTSATTTDGMSSAGGATSSGAGGSTTDSGGGSGGGNSSELGFFVTSDTSATGNLGGLAGADARCQALAEAVGAGDRTWRAYLSVESDPDNGNMPTNARDRIGQGPWVNSAGVVLANNLDELHSMSGDPELFLDENGDRINGQWAGSPSPVQHDILTGSDNDGNLLSGLTCDDWTSESGDVTAEVGHSDGLGPNQSSDPPYNSWNSAHENGGCDDTAPLGGAGRLYCFAAD